MCTSDWETSKNVHFCFFISLLQCIIIISLFKVNFTKTFHNYKNPINVCQWEDAPQRIILILTNPSKSVLKNVLKAWNFTTHKLRHRYFDSNLQKNFQTNILESDTANTFDSCFNSRIMLRQLTDLNFKMIPSLLVTRKYLRLTFKSCVVSTCKGTFCTHSGISDGNFCENSLKYLN